MGLFDKEDIKAEPSENAVVEKYIETRKVDTPVEIAVISSSTKIEGNITTDGNMIINGDVQGNISAKGNLAISGEGNTNGEIYCASVVFENKESHSDIVAEENVVVSEGTTVNGNINCKNVVVKGKVLGDISATGSVVLKASAVVNGNVFAKTIGMEVGAKVNGSISME